MNIGQRFIQLGFVYTTINTYTHSLSLSLSSHSELAQEMEHHEGEGALSSNEEDDYKPNRPGPVSENNTPSKSTVIGKPVCCIGLI